MTFPIENFDWKKSISQLFGVNKSLYSSKFGVAGHQGFDITIQDPKRGYGSPILASHTGIVSSVSFDDYPLHTKGNGIYLNWLGTNYATVYWHLSSMLVNAGDLVKEGQVIGTMGNSGYVNPVPSPDCEHCGSHLHFAVFDYADKDNLYKGFIDPLSFLYKQGDKLPIHFNRNLMFGMSGDDVSWLQSLLKLEGYADYQPTGFYGPKTMQGVRLLQTRLGYSSGGIVGPKTLNYLNYVYSA